MNINSGDVYVSQDGEGTVLLVFETPGSGDMFILELNPNERVYIHTDEEHIENILTDMDNWKYIGNISSSLSDFYDNIIKTYKIIII